MATKEKIMTALIFTTLLIGSPRDASSSYPNIEQNLEKEKISSNHVEVSHDHLPEEEMVHTTYKKQHQFSSLVK